MLIKFYHFKAYKNNKQHVDSMDNANLLFMYVVDDTRSLNLCRAVG